MLSWLAFALGAVPLAFLLTLHFRGEWRERAWWLMALGFAVSFVADALSLVVGHGVTSQVYLLSQGAVFAVALATRDVAVSFVAILAASAGASIALRHGNGLDVVLHTVAWGGVAGLGWLRNDAVGRVLAWGFAGLVLAWWGYVAFRTAGSLEAATSAWYVFQAVRLALTVGWCVAVAKHSNDEVA